VIEPHECWDYEVEMSSQPTRSGNIHVWSECELCGRTLTPPYHDSIL
jgi:hypothetical protein